MTETTQCPICHHTIESEVGIIDSLTFHFLQQHTPWQLAKELAQWIFNVQPKPER